MEGLEKCSIAVIVLPWIASGGNMGIMAKLMAEGVSNINRKPDAEAMGQRPCGGVDREKDIRMWEQWRRGDIFWIRRGAGRPSIRIAGGGIGKEIG